MTARMAILLLFISLAYAGDHKTLHFSAVVADGHNDVLLRAMSGEDISVRTTSGHSDIVRLKEGGVDVQLFSVWCGENYGKGRAFSRAMAMIDTLNAIVGRSAGHIGFAPTFGDLLERLKKKSMVAMIGVEGGHMIEDSIYYLEVLAGRGMNYLTLTWNNSTSWATSAADETQRGDSLQFKGLTDFGRKVIHRLNDLGVMVDLSHAGEQTFWDVMKITNKPVFVSHSSVYALCPNSRNLKDDQIRAVAKNQGVVCVNFYPGFIDSMYTQRIQEVKDSHRPLIDSVTQSTNGRYRTERAIDSLLSLQYSSVRPPLSVLVDHIDYIAKLVGPDYVGLGSDFDGIESVPMEMDDVTFLPNITKALLERGYAERDVEKILGGNILRVLQANMR